jgi:hypothetical protein
MNEKDHRYMYNFGVHDNNQALICPHLSLLLTETSAGQIIYSVVTDLALQKKVSYKYQNCYT